MVPTLLFVVLFAAFISSSYQVGQVTPTREMRVAALDSTSKSLYTLYFSVDTAIYSGNYLRVEYPTTSSVAASACWIKLYSDTDWTTATCSQSTSEVNVIYLLFARDVAASVEHKVEIYTSTNQYVAYASSAVIVSTVNTIDTTDQFVIDINNNFGQLPWTSDTTSSLSAALSITAPSTGYTYPGQLITLTVKVNALSAAVGSSLSPYSRFKIVIDSPWYFTSSSTVTTASYLSQTKPVIFSYEIESPNQISVVFSEYLTTSSSRAYSVVITNVQNPLLCNQSGGVNVYVMDYNSNFPIVEQSLTGLTTIQYPITVLFQAPGGITFANAFNFPAGSSSTGGVVYGVMQHVEFAITSSIQIPAGSSIRVTFTTTGVSIINGSAFLDKQILPNDPTTPITYTYSTSSILIISNLSTLPLTTSFVVTCRILVTTTDSTVYAYVHNNIPTNTSKNSFLSPTFTTQVSIDSATTATYLTALYVSSQMSAKVLTSAASYLGLPTTNRIAPLGSTLSLYYNGSVGSTTTANTSQLVLNFPYLIKKASSGSVTCNNSLTCAFTVLTSTFNQISITSPSGTNFFTSGTAAATITISGLSLATPSNNEDKIFQVYGCLKVTSSSTATCLYTILSFVIATASPATITQSIVGNNYQSSLNYYFASVVSAHFTDATIFSSITPSTGQVRFVTLFAKQGLRRLTGLMASQATYPCGANVEVTCMFMQGNDPANAQTYDFLNWDRVIFFLDDTVVGNLFRLSVPDIFTSDTTVVYEYIWAYELTLTTSSKTSMSLSLTGNAGQEVSGIALNLYSSSSQIGRNSNVNGLGGAVVINSEWLFWQQFSSTMKATTGMPFGTGSDTPISIPFTDADGIKHHIAVLPLTNTATIMKLGVIYYGNQVLMPYLYDIPNYVMLITQASGEIDSYSEKYNQGTDMFYSSSIYMVDFSCTNMAIGVANTFCSLSLQPSNIIQQNAAIYAIFTGVLVSTDACDAYISYGVSWNTISGVICTTSNDSKQLYIRFGAARDYPNSQTYRFDFYGVSFAGSGTKSLDLQIRDSSEKFIIEEETFLITTSSYAPETISVTQLQYVQLNPYVYTSLLIKFTTPRELYSNEDLFITIGKDLQDVNSLATRFHATLTLLSDDSVLPIAMRYANSRLKVLFADYTQFEAGSYQLNLTSIRTPSSNLNDKFQMMFVRRKDSEVVVSNPTNATVAFPSLPAKAKSVVSLISGYYLLEGDLEELTFNITLSTSNLNSSSIIDVNFPVYHAPGGADFASNLYCTVNNVTVSCERVVLEPYKIRISNPSVNVYVGTTFTLKIFGLKAPSYSYRYSTNLQDETIFVSVDSNGDSTYDDFIHVSAPETYPINNSGTAQKYIRVVHVIVDTPYLRSTSLHTVRLKSQEAIPSGAILMILFPNEYTTLQSLTQLYVILKYINSGTTLTEISRSYCTVIGRRIEIPFSIAIASGKIIQLEIQSVPTPTSTSSSTLVVDFNDILIQVFSSTRLNLIARSYYLINTSMYTTFTRLSNYLVINGDDEIRITKGTYTKELEIDTYDSTAFNSNIQLISTATSFNFIPYASVLLYGTYTGGMRIGADKNLYDQLYTFTVSKQEIAYTTLYNVESSMVAVITSDPVTITLPSSFTVPRGGCSAAQLLDVVNAPFDELTVNLYYDNQIYTEDAFRVDLEISSNILAFSPNITSRYMSFCVTSSLSTSITSIPIKYYIGGVNAPSYELATSSFSITVVNKTSITSPSLSVAISTVSINSVSVTVISNADGQLYWNLFSNTQSVDKTPLTLVEIKQNLKNSTFTVEQQADNLKFLYTNRRQSRVGVATITKVQDNTVTISKLTAGITYKFCSYLDTEFKINSGDVNCVSFTTTTNGSLAKATFILNRAITKYELNTLLCYFVEKGKLRLYNLIDQQGNTCAFGTSYPNALHINYAGTTSAASLALNVYVYPLQNSTSNTGMTTFTSLFISDLSALTTTVLSNAQSLYSMTYLKSGSLKFTFSYKNALLATSPLTVPSVSSISMKAIIGTTAAALNISSTVLSSTSGDGTVYVIAENQKLLVKTNSTNVDIQIRESITPTPSQILNCLNYYNETATYCGRLIVTSTLTTDGLSFAGATLNSNYKIYYIVTNEYPITPVVGSSPVVTTKYITTYQSGNILMPILSVMALIITFVF